MQGGAPLKRTTPSVLAIVAHPDDIEMMMGGTLLRLHEAGWQVHYQTLADGSCGGSNGTRAQLIAQRAAEARAGAKVLGATWHRPLVHDLEITYCLPLLRRVAALVRQVKPTIVLTHGPDDYMEDHIITGRLAVTAAFARGMQNFATTPRQKPVEGAVAVYHSLPHVLADQLGRPIRATHYVDVGAVHERCRQALECHRSQAEWLAQSQGATAVSAMAQAARAVGRQSKKFRLAEGWRRHLSTGLGEDGDDPLAEALGGALVIRSV